MIKTKKLSAKVSFTVLISALFLLVNQISFAQGTRGTIRGTVTDPNGAVVTNATVKLNDVKKGTTVRTVTTNENGEYQFVEIEPSTYQIIITAANFAELKLNDFTVEPNRNLVLDAALSVTAGTAQVEVTAGAEQIDRESPTLGTTVENRRIEGLPLNGRNVLNLATLQPGVTITNNVSTGVGTGFRVNGSRSVENNVMLDGSNNNEVASGGIIGGLTRPDAVQEFRLLTSNFEAEFGRNTGSIVNVVTKSGTNEYHGNARFFYRPTFLSAANFFDNAFGASGVDHRQPFERKEFGFNIGGPVPFFNFGEGGPMFTSGKDRTFFFADYERRWQKVAGTVSVTGLPTPAELGGNFSALGRPIYDPTTATAANPAGNPFPGNIIPASRFSPIAKYYLQFFPTTDATGRAVVNNDTLTLVNYFTGRLDHNFTPNHLLSFTYNYTDSDVSSGIEDNDGADIGGFGTADVRKAQNYAARYTSIFGSNVVNTFLFSYARNDFPSSAPVNRTSPSQIGFTANFVANPAFAGPPYIQIFDRNFQIGNSIQGPQARLVENFQVQDALSWIVGNHRLKFGGDFVQYKQGQDFLFINNGSLFYSAEGVEGSNTVGDDFADFLLGNTPIAAQYGSNGRRDYRQHTYAFFAQDTWRTTKQLTLSLGLRYEFVSPLTDTENRVAYYRSRAGVTSPQLINGTLTFEGQRIVVPAGGRAPNGLLYVGDPDPVLGGTVPAGGVKPDRNNFAPRIGFAYSFTGSKGFLGRFLGENQTVLRGGFGLYYGAIIGDTALQQLSATGFQGTNAFYFPGNGTLANPFGPDPYPLYRYLGGDEILGAPNANPFLSTADILVSAPLTAIAQPLDPNLRTPIVTQYNLTLERSFARDYVFGISYVGNRGRKLYVAEEINPALGTLIPASARIQGGAIPTPSSANINTRRVNNDIQQSIRQLASKGRSAFDSLQVNFQKRFSDDGLTFQLAYTFSKSLSDTDTQRGNIDILNQREGWGRSLDDHPNRFVGSFIYELPFFKNSNGFAKRLLDGWSIGAIYTYQSGDVFSVINPIDTTGVGLGVTGFADIGQPYTQLDPKTNNLRAFNANAFVIADCRILNAAGTPVSGRNYDRCINADGTKGRRGTSGRNQFRLDNPINNWDAILAKKIRLFSERNNLELRFEAFNLFNTTQFTTVDLNLTTAGNPNFGTFTAAGQARVIQLGARLNF
jgi:hypothetical protein